MLAVLLVSLSLKLNPTQIPSTTVAIMAIIMVMDMVDTEDTDTVTMVIMDTGGMGMDTDMEDMESPTAMAITMGVTNNT